MPRSAGGLPATLAILATLALATNAQADWIGYTHPDFGARLIYPDHVFEPAPPEPDSPEARFLSPDGTAQLSVATWHNVDGRRPENLKSLLLEDASYDDLTYQPGGRSWFVLSGYRGSDIYYEKVMFSCNGAVVSAFGLTYPQDQRDRYDPVVERIEDTFRPGPGCP